MDRHEGKATRQRQNGLDIIFMATFRGQMPVLGPIPVKAAGMFSATRNHDLLSDNLRLLFVQNQRYIGLTLTS